VDPVGVVLTLVLAGSAFYRTVSGKREALTAGLWVGSLALGAASLGALLDPNLKGFVGLGLFAAFVISSYLIARLTYRIAQVESPWPIVFTLTSLTGIVTLYCATELHGPQDLADYIGTADVRWQPTDFYPFAWAILLIGFGALALAGVISTARNRQAAPAVVGV
jgi:uncharacterized membrane protein (UPF0136 family)